MLATSMTLALAQDAAPKGKAPAYYVADFELTDPEGIKPYRDQVDATFERYGGRYIVRAAQLEGLEGNPPSHRLVIIQFDSIEQARAWYNSRNTPRSGRSGSDLARRTHISSRDCRSEDSRGQAARALLGSALRVNPYRVIAACIRIGRSIVAHRVPGTWAAQRQAHRLPAGSATAGVALPARPRSIPVRRLDDRPTTRPAFPNAFGH
jgi:uncharacterized protein (DUF1330 family)